MLKSVRRPVALTTYGVIALLLLGPLLLAGFILSLDMIFTPDLRMPVVLSSSYVFKALLHLLDLILPADLIQKVMLFAIFVLAGYGMHRLLRSLTERLQLDYKNELPSYFGGLLYAVNPFTYDRLMAGQYFVLFGYALLPWFARAVQGMLLRPSWKRALVVVAWAMAVSIVSIHTIGMALIVAALAGGVQLWHDRRSGKKIKRLAVYVGGAMAACVLAASYWLLPVLAGVGQQAQTIHSITATDRQAFATSGSSPLERLGNVLGLQGFWAERYDLFKMPQEVITTALWSLLMLTLISIVVVGSISWWKRGGEARATVLVYGGCIVIGAILAAGIGGNWMAAHVPFFAGYREPQKFVALVALGHGVLAAQGFAVVTERLLRSRRHPQIVAGTAAGLLILLPALLTPTIWWGANNQLHAAEYPAGWYAVKQQLDSDKSNFKTVFLPWHMYSYMSFAGRVIANPARNFFDTPVIVSNDPELAGAALDTTDPDAQQVAALLPNASQSDHRFGQQLRAMGVKYVIVAHETDWQKYTYIDHQKNLVKTADYPDISLYRVK